MGWRTVPFGYRVEGGKVAVEETEAAQLRQMLENYIGGMSYRAAAESVGCNFTHARMKRLMQDRRAPFSHGQAPTNVGRPVRASRTCL